MIFSKCTITIGGEQVTGSGTDNKRVLAKTKTEKSYDFVHINVHFCTQASTHIKCWLAF